MANNASAKRFWAQLIGVLSTIGICTLSAFVDYILTRGISTALWIGSAVIIALIVPNWIYNWQTITQTDRNLRERLSRLVANTCSGSVVDIALIFVFLIYTAQISAAINDAIVNNSPWWRPLIYAFALGISVLQKPLLTDQRGQNTARVLITGLSNITYSVKGNEESSNIYPAILPIEKFHDSIKLVVLIVSKESFKRIKNPENPPADANKLSLYSKLSPYFANSGTTSPPAQSEADLNEDDLIKIIRSLCENNDLEVIISQPVDFDNFEECNRVILSQTKAILADSKRKYNDCDLMFNISPGTKMLTGAMTINAIKGERNIVYISQNRNKKDLEKVIAYDPNVLQLYEQFNELVAELSENNNK